jgi:hypothetical protein
MKRTLKMMQEMETELSKFKKGNNPEKVQFVVGGVSVDMSKENLL